MDPLSSSSPRRDAELQDELQQIASQMELETQADVDVQFATDESESGDEDALGLDKGLGWMAGGRIHSIHTCFRKEKAVHRMRLIQITNRNNIR